MSHPLGNHFNRTNSWCFCSWKEVAAKLRAHGDSPRQFVLAQDW
jgi:hypothetical protein